MQATSSNTKNILKVFIIFLFSIFSLLSLTDEIREGQSTGGKCLCNVRDGRYIREGQSTGGRQLIKIQDAAKAIGTSAQGPSTALVWWFFGR